MKQDLFLVYPVLVLLPLLLSGLALYKSAQYKRVEFRHLSEFYLSMLLVSASSWFLLPLGSAFIILSMLPWMWCLRTFGLICEDVSKQTLFSKFHYYVLALGGIISIILMSFNFALEMMAAPFSLSIALIGFTFIFQLFFSEKNKPRGYLQHINLFLILSFFLSRLLFPLFIATPAWAQLPIIIDSYLLVAFCGALYPLYAELVFESQEHILEKVLDARNKQLLTHSGFSEFRILSAGLSHEINNALTIINAKLSQLMRDITKQPEKDLEVIQRATNRIVDSIRGLREFIYPHEVQEVLDLGEVVHSVLEFYGQRLVNHGVRVEINGLDGKLVKGKMIQLEQVFLSLINNSVDAIDKLEDKWISISAKATQGTVQIEYKDSGPSKVHQLAPLLSDPDYKYHEFVDNDIRLILTKEILEKHGGGLTCMASSDYSTFAITLPLSDDLKSASTALESKIEEIKELH